MGENQNELAGRFILGICALKVAEEFFHGNGIGVLFGGRLWSVTQKELYCTWLSNSGVTGSRNQTTGRPVFPAPAPAATATADKVFGT